MKKQTVKKKHHRHILRNVLLAFVALVVLGVVTLAMMPTEWINRMIGGKASNATGRELAIDGDITIDWDWKTPTVHVGKIRMSNIEGAADPQMVEIESLDFSIRIWKLLLFRLDLPELNISSPKIILEQDENGVKNWELPAMSKGNAAANAALPDSRGNFPLIGLMNIKDGTFIYRDKAKGLDLKLTVDTVQGDSRSQKDMFKLSGGGTFQDQKFTIDASGGSLKMLRGSDEPFPLKLDLGMGATKISVNGTFQDPVKLEGVDTILDIRGDNLADLFYLTSIPLPPSPPYSLSGTLKKSGDLWSFNEFSGKVGDSDLGGNATYDVSGERGFLKADLKSALLDIDDIGGFIGVAPSTKKGETASAEQKQQAREQAADSKVLPDVKLDLTRLRATDLDVTLKVAKIDAPGIPLSTMNVRFDLNDGLLKLNPMDLGVAGGIIDGELALDGRENTPDVKMDLNLKKLKLKPFFSGSQFESFSSGTFGGRIVLAGKGKSLAEVLAVSDGHVTLSMSGGKISRLLVEAAGIDIGELTPLLLGEDDNTTIRCVVGDFDVKNGLLKSNAFVFDTTDTNIQGDAQINLKNEGLAIRVEAHPKDASLLTLRTPITIGGTMKNPAIGIDPSGIAARGVGAAVLGVLLPPLAVLPFIELGLGEDSDCRDLISAARKSSAKAVADQPQTPQ